MENLEKCAACGNECEQACTINRGDGRGDVRYPICDTDCWDDLMSQMGSGLGRQVTGKYPV